MPPRFRGLKIKGKGRKKAKVRDLFQHLPGLCGNICVCAQEHPGNPTSCSGRVSQAGKGLGSSLHPRGWIHLSCLTTSIFILSSGQTPAARCWLLRNQPEHLLVPPTPRDALLPFPCAPHTRAGRGDALRSRRGGRESPIPAIRCRQRQNGRLLLRALRLSETLTETKESPLGELSPSAWNRARALAAGGSGRFAYISRLSRNTKCFL